MVETTLDDHRVRIIRRPCGSLLTGTGNAILCFLTRHIDRIETNGGVYILYMCIYIYFFYFTEDWLTENAINRYRAYTSGT